MIYFTLFLTIVIIFISQFYLWLSRLVFILNKFSTFQTTQFKNVPQTIEPKWLTVQGKIPPWLNGILYRIGPGVFILEDEKKTITLNHAFDGMPFLHRFEISSERQQVRYNSRNMAIKAEEKIKHGEATIFFGHIVPHSSVWGQFCHLLKIFNNLVLQPRLNTLMEKDPSSEMVGVTPTPNFPLPKGAAAGFVNKNLPVLVAKTDANLLQKVNADNLVPEKLFNYSQYDKQLNGELAAAHHQYDPDTKEVFNFTLKFGMKPLLIVFSSTSTGEVTILAKITHRLDKDRTPINLCYIHSFWLTKNFIIIPESPLYMKNHGLDFMASGSFLAGLKWDESLPTYLHIISRRSDQGHIATVPVDDSFFTFHVGNAWDSHDEKGNLTLNLDCAAFPDGDIAYQVHTFGKPRLYNDDNDHDYNKKNNMKKTNGFTFPPLPQSSFGELRRYKLTLTKLSMSTYSPTSTTFETIVDNMEFLRYNQEYAMNPYRFTYGNQFESLISTSFKSSSSESNDNNINKGERYSIIKVDLNNGDILKFDHEGYVCSEPIFVPKPNSDTEDDGVVLSFVNIMKKDNNDEDNQCFLLILDALSLNEIARCHIGFFTATTFHGSFVDEEFESIAIN